VDIRDLTWDDWNQLHIARHSIDPDEVEEVCYNPRSLGVRIRRGRYRVIGQAMSGRYLTVILDAEPEATFYVVTARDASDSERRRLHRWRGR